MLASTRRVMGELYTNRLSPRAPRSPVTTLSYLFSFTSSHRSETGGAHRLPPQTFISVRLSLLARGARGSARADDGFGRRLLRRRLLGRSLLGRGLLGRGGLGRGGSLLRRRLLRRLTRLLGRSRGGFDRLGGRLALALRARRAARRLGRKDGRDNQEHLHDDAEGKNTHSHTRDERERGIHLGERLLGRSLGGGSNSHDCFFVSLYPVFVV